MVVGSILVIGLLATSAVTIAAQEEGDVDELTATSYVTGTSGDPRQTIPGTDESRGGGLVEHRGYTWADSTVDTDDPRLNGIMNTVANGDTRFLDPASGEFTDVQAFSVRITNDEGGWSGQGTALIHGNGSTATTNLDTIILVGDGAYEGLTAYVLIDGTTTPVSLEGTIFQGEMTPFPEPPAE